MKRWTTPASWLARAVLAGVFLWAGIQKARNPVLFALDLEAYRLLPPALILPIAYYLPWLEILTALALFIPPLRRSALWLAMGLLAIFTTMLIIAWARGLQINCGCFGAVGSGATDWLIAIVRNLSLLAGAAWLLTREPRSAAGLIRPRG